MEGRPGASEIEQFRARLSRRASSAGLPSTVPIICLRGDRADVASHAGTDWCLAIGIDEGETGDLDASIARATEQGLDVLAAGSHPSQPSVRVLVVGQGDSRRPEPAPSSFRVAAVMTAFNEADIVRPSIERLIDQGIDVYLIDNWSDDGTAAAVEDLLGRGLLRIDRFPLEGRPDFYDWTGLLRHVEEVAAELPHDWIIHHDVDQRRESSLRGVTYRDMLWTAQRWGCNAVDHTILEFRPTDDDFVDGTEPSEHLRYFEFVPAAATATHVQAWRNLGEVVDLHSSGGHDVSFEGRAVFPLNQVLRHYPVRSQRHGERKVFRDRKPRYSVQEMDRGWHYHYARLRAGHRFIREPSELIEWAGDRTVEEHLLPILGQIGMRFPAEEGMSHRLRRVARSALRRTGLGPAYVKARNRVVAWRR